MSMSIADFAFPSDQKGHISSTVEIRFNGETVARVMTDKPLSSTQLKMGMVASELLPLMEDSGVSAVTLTRPIFIRDDTAWDNAQTGEDIIRLIEQGTIPADTTISFENLDKWGILDKPEQFLLSDEPNVFLDGTPVFFN